MKGEGNIRTMFLDRLIQAKNWTYLLMDVPAKERDARNTLELLEMVEARFYDGEEIYQVHVEMMEALLKELMEQGEMKRKGSVV